MTIDHFSQMLCLVQMTQVGFVCLRDVHLAWLASRHTEVVSRHCEKVNMAMDEFHVCGCVFALTHNDTSI